MPIEFASSAKVDRYAWITGTPLTRLLGFGTDDPVFLSDEWNPWDFCEGDTLAESFARTESVFGVNLNELRAL